jgi:ABC-type branched-subunit amino acid transport system ATPase component/branched-subunit amino acid ABC-type transport system permease component
VPLPFAALEKGTDMTASESRWADVGEWVQRAWANSDVRYGTTLAGGALAFLIFVGVLYPAPAPLLALGLVLGSLSALIAMGLVLVYRANRMINFAQGDLGGVAAILTASLIVGPKWPFFPAAIAGLLFALTLGALIEVTIIRRFAKAPRLIVTVATIGVTELLAFAELGLPRLFNYDQAPQPPLPFHVRFEWFPVTFNAGHIVIMVVVPLVALGLAAFFRFTRVGIAVRASAESADRAALLGIPVKRIGTLVWVLAAGLSGLGVLLRLPIQGVGIGSVLGPLLLLRALAAAVIARMEKLHVAFFAALVLGMLEQAVFYTTHRTLIVDGVLFFIIVGALLIQRRGDTSRAEAVGASSWSSTREVRPIPRELRRVPEVRFGVIGLALVAVVLLLSAPALLSASQLNLFDVGIIFSIAIISLVVLTGMAGQISLGQAAFIAFGMSITGVLSLQGKEFFTTILLGALTGAAIAVAIGLPALRFRGLFLAVTTLALAVSTGSYFLNHELFPSFALSESARVLRPIIFNKFDLESETTFYYFVLVIFLLVVASVTSLRRARIGRVLVATRDNAQAAQSYGVSPVKAKLVAFAFSGFLAALAGSLYVYSQHGLSRTPLEPQFSITLFLVAVIGGLGSIPGALLGGAFLTFVNYSPFTKQPLSQFLASGAFALFVLLLFPNGVGGLLYDIRDDLLRRVARARKLVVPSLLADILVADDGVTIVEANGHRAPRERRAEAPSDPNNLLTVRGLDVAYGKTQVLFGVDFDVRRGEIVALLGTNGAGKSTLLNTISGLLEPSGGTVSYDGNDITDRNPQQRVGMGVVMVPGGKGVFPTLTVQENLELASWLFRKDPAHVEAATARVLEYFPILRDRWDQKAGNLSGGEQQMLTLGQAFIAQPKLLMIDELSLGLAPVVVEQLLEIVKAIHDSGTTIVLVEQSVNVAITLAERAVFMEKGEVRFDGRTADLLDRPDVLHAVFLKGTAAAQGNGGARTAQRANGRTRTFTEVCEHCGHSHPMALEVTDITVNFGGVLAVAGVSFDVHRQQVLGIIGPNGAGKTTVFDAVSGFVPLSGGRVRLGGTDVTELTPDGRAMLGLGRSFQDARLFPSMTVRQTVAVARERHMKVRDPIAAALMSPATVMSERVVAGEVDELIELMRLTAFADKFVGELSTGTRRIVDLACSLAHEPDVLLLDEPSSGIAQRETEALGPLLLDIRDRTGAALVIIEHDMPLITSVSDELLALDLGSVVTRGDPDYVINHPQVVEGYLGGREEVIQRSGTLTKTRSRRRTKKEVAS